MKALLKYNATTKAVTEGDEEWTPPTLVFGESLTTEWRYARQIDGAEIPDYAETHTLRASVGVVDARPDSGTWRLQVGAGPSTPTNTTTDIQYNAQANGVAAAIEACRDIVTAHGAPAVTSVAGSWRIVFGDGAEQVPMEIRTNNLFPTSLLEVTARQIDGVWVHELRLVQAPIAFTDQWEAVLPPLPAMTSVRDGSTDGALKVNTLHSLTMPQSFRGTFEIVTTSGQRSSGLSVSDTIATVTAALEVLHGAGNVVVSLALDFVLQIEYVGELEGINVPVPGIEPLDTPPGAPTLTLTFDTDELVTLLRRAAVVTLPIEICAVIQLTEEKQETWVLLRSTITLLRPLILPQLALVPRTDYIRPPSPIDYRHYSPDTVITGQQFYPEEVGDGLLTEWVVDHGLDTTLVRVWVVQNISNGLQLVEGTDFRVRIINANSVRVTSLVGAPGANAWLVVVMSAQTVAAFAAGLTVEIDQVNGLEAQLAAIKARVTSLEAMAPSSPLTRTQLESAAAMIMIPDRVVVYPNARIPDSVILKDLGEADAKALQVLPAPGAFLPAIADSSISDFDTTLPTPTAGQGYRNTGSTRVLLPGRLQRRSSYLQPNEVAGFDGRTWYRLVRDGATAWHFPAEYEQLLVPDLVFEADTWQAGQTFQLIFQVGVRVLRASSPVQWTLVIEHGVATSETSPSPAPLNLQAITWHATPLLSQRLIVSDLLQTRRFGCQIERAANDAISAMKLVQNAWTVASSAPASPAFLVRVRMVRFDTRNADADARGYAFAALTEAKAAII